MASLSGLKVLDFTLNLPGPYCTSVLASQGADVVKVEPPQGDPARHLPALFEQLNRGKRSLTLDLREAQERSKLPALFDWADVVVEGFRPGVMERLEAGPEQAHRVNPRLIYCRISAYGQTGPRALQPGHDLNLQSLTGLCHLERLGSTPHPIRLPIADLSASMSAVAAIAIALAGDRDHEVLDISMAETLLSWVSVWSAVDPGGSVGAATRSAPRFTQALLRRALRPLRAKLEREKLYAMPQYGLYAASDGWIAVGIVDEPHFWQDFADAVGLRRFRGLKMPGLILAGPLLAPRIRRALRQKRVSDWMHIFDTAGLPVTPVLDAQAARQDPQFPDRIQHGQVVPPLPGSKVPEEHAPALGSTCVEALSGP